MAGNGILRPNLVPGVHRLKACATEAVDYSARALLASSEGGVPGMSGT